MPKYNKNNIKITKRIFSKIKIINFYYIECVENCEICQQNFTFECDQCASDFYLFNNKNNTITCSACNLPGNFIVNSTHCIICDEFCKICQSSTTCNTCIENYYLNPLTKNCISECPEEYYADAITGACKACDSKCSKCYGEHDNECFECKFSFVYLNNSCLNECPLNMVPDVKNYCICIYFLFLTM